MHIQVDVRAGAWRRQRRRRRRRGRGLNFRPGDLRPQESKSTLAEFFGESTVGPVNRPVGIDQLG